ncbi:MAG: AmmeMemoRadiSam system radical SAM enzyme [Deltaproteobacteria bacterium]|nr:AmmeMemoRadiSam system radical SAM enzyme [Candidatus Zymogenaceae bacterium]
MHHASLYSKLENRRAQCRVCLRRCAIPEGALGWCKTRINKGGKIFSLTYGRVSSIMVSPVEVKPMFHFLPGSNWLSVGSVGCNFTCPGCQNWEIAHAVPDIKGSYCIQGQDKKIQAEYLAPEVLIEISHRERVEGLSFTYNEPTLWVEYAQRAMTLAKEAGLSTNWVTNGYLTSDALDYVGNCLDAFRVDIKGFSEKTYRLIGGIVDYRDILEAVRRAKLRWGMHVELVTNIIPGVNDDRRELTNLVGWIIRELGAGTPWHITRFTPQHQWSGYPATSIEALEDIYRMAKQEGLHYPYIGNVSGHPFANTVCSSCGELLIDRREAGSVVVRLSGSSCPGCGALIPGRFEQKA